MSTSASSAAYTGVLAEGGSIRLMASRICARATIGRHPRAKGTPSASSTGQARPPARRGMFFVVLQMARGGQSPATLRVAAPAEFDARRRLLGGPERRMKLCDESICTSSIRLVASGNGAYAAQCRVWVSPTRNPARGVHFEIGVDGRAFVTISRQTISSARRGGRPGPCSGTCT